MQEVIAVLKSGFVLMDHKVSADGYEAFFFEKGKTKKIVDVSPYTGRGKVREKWQNVHTRI